jgi:hypothetical protein
LSVFPFYVLLSACLPTCLLLDWQLNYKKRAKLKAVLMFFL